MTMARMVFQSLCISISFCRWCCFVMLHADQDGEKLQALLRLVIELLERVKIVEALSTVPQMYCLAVVEVVRRKMFIKHYREVCRLSCVYCVWASVS